MQETKDSPFKDTPAEPELALPAVVIDERRKDLNAARNQIVSAVPDALVVLEPKQYIAEIFEPYIKQLTEAIAEREKAGELDLTKKPGYEMAIKLRAAFRTVRVEADKIRLERKRPLMEIQALLDETYRTGIETIARPMEIECDVLIKSEDRRKAEEKRKAEEAERARVEVIQAAIKWFQNKVLECIGYPSGVMQAALLEIQERQITEDVYQEFMPQAAHSKDIALKNLGSMLEGAVKAERIEAERAAEAERLRVEAEALARMREEFAREKAAAAAEHEKKMAELENQLKLLQSLKDEAEPDKPATDINQGFGAPVFTEELDGSDLAPSVAGLEVQELNVEETFSREPSDAELAAAVRIQSNRLFSMMARPSDKDLVHLIAEQFKVSYAIAIDWLSVFDADMAREEFKQLS